MHYLPSVNKEYVIVPSAIDRRSPINDIKIGGRNIADIVNEVNSAHSDCVPIDLLRLLCKPRAEILT